MYKLTRETIAYEHGNPCRHNWPLRVTVTSDLPDVDVNIFVYQAGEASSGLEHGDRFSNVASMQDMEVLPVGAPAEVSEPRLAKDAYIPFYRTNVVELDFYNLVDLDRAWRIMQHDVSSLVKEYRVWEGNLKKGQKETVEI